MKENQRFNFSTFPPPVEICIAMHLFIYFIYFPSEELSLFQKTKKS